jgi:hypothetical protein
LGSGAACGSIYLTKGFEKFLRQRLGATSNVLDDPMVAKGANDMFESFIKCSFDPDEDEDEDEEYNIPLNSVADIPSINLMRGYLKLSTFTRSRLINDRSHIDSIFKPVFQQIYELVKGQLDGVAATGSPAKVGPLFQINYCRLFSLLAA